MATPIKRTWKTSKGKILKDRAHTGYLPHGLDLGIGTDVRNAYDKFRLQISDLMQEMDEESDPHLGHWYNDSYELKEIFMKDLEVTVTIKSKTSRAKIKRWIIKQIEKQFNPDSWITTYTNTCDRCDQSFETGYEWSSLCPKCILKHANTIM